MKSKARVSIARRSGFQGDGSIAITVTDDSSGIRICEVEMEFSDFAECLTGLASRNADLTFVPNKLVVERYGKKRVVEYAFCDKKSSKDDMKKKVIEDFGHSYSDEWELWDDGTSTQQNGKLHKYIICKYV